MSATPSAARLEAGLVSRNIECSTRTRLMRAVLTALGYRTRDVAIFDSHSNLKSHSFLEVLNPKTGRWETQDADFDIYWRDKQTGERISLAQRAEGLDAIEPCGRDVCGWDHASREDLKPDMLKTFLDIVSVTDRENGLRYAVYTSRADRGRVYRKDGETGSFCERYKPPFIAKVYRASPAELARRGTAPGRVELWYPP